MLDGTGGLEIQVVVETAQHVVQIADEETATDHTDHVAGFGIARARGRRGEGLGRHLDGGQRNDLDAQAAIDRRLIDRVFGRAADPQAVEWHLGRQLRQAEGLAFAEQMLDDAADVVGDQDGGVGLDGAEWSLEVLEALEEAREHRVAVVGEIQVALGLDPRRRDGQRLMHPQEVGDIRVAGEGLAPVGVAVDIQL